MKYASICSGIEAATVAFKPLEWDPVFFSEIEAFPCAVLADRYPNIPNLGDAKKFKNWPDAKFDLLIGGTPCQSFSIAGLRKGLADPRGSLLLVYLAILDRYRPVWLVWENVPGILSNNQGRDFGTFIGALGQLGYGFAYRILDAQYFGIPQRRKRVFVIGYLGDWRRAAAVLFERESLRGNPPPSRKAGEKIADPITASFAKHGGCSAGKDSMPRNLIASGGNNTSGRLETATACRAKGGSGHGDFESETFVVHSLRGEGFDASEDGTGRGIPLIAETITSNWYKSSGSVSGKNEGLINPIFEKTGVRRLTPRECERLQGFPDDYTLVPYRNRMAKDGPRYKAIGNSFPVPVIRWIGERIEMVENLCHSIINAEN